MPNFASDARGKLTCAEIDLVYVRVMRNDTYILSRKWKHILSIWVAKSY